MLTIYQIGAGGYWTGATREIGEKDGTHRGWTRSPVPTLAAGEYAVWSANGWKVTTQEYVAPPSPPPPVPSSITPRQLILGAMQDGWITSAEAESWANGSSLPAVVLGVINTLPEADRPAARITALRMTEALRANPLLIATATALNIDEEDLDDAFRNWSLL